MDIGTDNILFSRNYAQMAVEAVDGVRADVKRSLIKCRPVTAESGLLLQSGALDVEGRAV